VFAVRVLPSQSTRKGKKTMRRENIESCHPKTRKEKRRGEEMPVQFEFELAFAFAAECLQGRIRARGEARANLWGVHHCTIFTVSMMIY